MTHDTLERVRCDLAETLADLGARLFSAEMRLTLIARCPGNEECELVITEDDLGEVGLAIDRAGKRAAVPLAAQPEETP